MPQDFAQVTARQQIEDEIERLIGILDAMDPDPDLEPSLGLGGFPYCRAPEAADLEDECEDEGAQCDDEGMPDNEDACSFGDDQGTLYNPDMAERNRVTDSVVAINDRLRAVMHKRGLAPVPAISNMGGSQWRPR